jgi:type I restriction enzyme S subunit
VGQASTETGYDGDFDPTYLVEPGELVVGMDGDFRAALWRGPRALLNQRVCKLSPREEFYSPRLMIHAIPGYLDAINAKTSAITVKHLSSRTVEDIPLPLPPRSEQDRIAERLDVMLGDLDHAVVLLKRVEQNLKRYRASVLKAAVEGRLVPTEAELARREGRDYEPASELLKRILAERKTRWIEDAAVKARAKAEEKAHKAGKPWTAEDNAATLEKERAKAAKQYKEPAAPDLSALRAQAGTADLADLPEGWCWATAGQVLNTLEGGNSASAQDEETGRRVLRSSAVRQSHIDFTDHRFLRADAPAQADPYLSKGDVLFTRLSGSIAYVGNCAIVPGVGLEKYEYPDRLFRGRVHGAVDGQYFHHCFATPALRRQIEETVKSAAGHQRIGLDDLRRYAFPLPPAGEQRRVAQAVERSLGSSRVVFDGVVKQRKCAMKLRQSILKWAFEGKLVEQDPSDEPASALLERIKAMGPQSHLRRRES